MAHKHKTIHYVLMCVVIVGFTAVFQHKRAAGIYENMRKAHLHRAQKPMVLERVCGSPAIDGYAHVDPECLNKSPTNTAYSQFLKMSVGLGTGPPDWKKITLEHSDVDGLAVGWGIGNKKESTQECEKACVEHSPEWLGGMNGGPFAQLPCNAWAWCPDEVCWEPDAHSHTKGDCWLKFTEAPHIPELNMQGKLSASMRERHAEAPEIVQWVSGVLLLPGLVMSNGTWGPRSQW